jgi:hypothetical protein
MMQTRFVYGTSACDGQVSSFLMQKNSDYVKQLAFLIIINRLSFRTPHFAAATTKGLEPICI